jgi:trimeric autotransporter adhesin
MKTATKLLIATLALVFLYKKTNAQSTQSGLGVIGHSNLGGVATHYIGWDAASTIPLSLEHRGNFPINFQTNGVQRMTIMNTTGFVGINIVAPNQLLTVDAGNININTTSNGYMIGNTMTLWRGSAGSGTNIFVGANTGTANTTGVSNTFIGNNAGASNTTATDNTFIGYNAGTNTVTGGALTARDNVFVGSMAGQANTSGRQNVFVGFRAGQNTTTVGAVPGEMNTFIGNTAGSVNTSGSFNTYLGDQTGAASTTGNNNLFLGRSA